MQGFILFLVLTIVFVVCFSQSQINQKTRTGQKMESMTTLTSQYLSPILSNYLREHYIKYALYKLPNYIIDLLKFNNNFSAAYSAQDKYLIIIFMPADKLSQEYLSFKPFYDKIYTLVKEYDKKFQLITFEYDKTNEFAQTYDKTAYKDLKKYCDKFCLINPSANTMFVFNKITNTEVEALDVVFQQYNNIK
ncbi:MAG: hypothetical protein ACI37Q_00520 [Candidatus Gastranaerophilaceae bacterium]